MMWGIAYGVIGALIGLVFAASVKESDDTNALAGVIWVGMALVWPFIVLYGVLVLLGRIVTGVAAWMEGS